MELIDFGIGDYEEVLNLQENLFTSLVEAKKNKQEGKELILSGQHNPVITLGRKADYRNVLMPINYILQQGISIFKINRGGDVTYHGPGQIIVYPIIDLEKHKLGVKDYVFLLEESIILLLEKYGIKGDRIEGATGVWIGAGSEKERKISAIGIKCSRWCTMHGLSLNVNCDMRGFSMINPCGFSNKGVTTLELETGVKMNPLEIKKELLQILLRLIN